jgi:hypothetical protein
MSAPKKPAVVPGANTLRGGKNTYGAKTLIRCGLLAQMPEKVCKACRFLWRHLFLTTILIIARSNFVEDRKAPDFEGVRPQGDTEQAARAMEGKAAHQMACAQISIR